MSVLLEEDQLLSEALRLMTIALELLDQSGKVAMIGAQLDLARATLDEHVQELLKA